MTRPATDHDDDGAQTRRKTTLFCWECDHSSPIDGDWVVQSRDRRVAYVCPECETTLTKRPRRDEPTRERTPSGPLAAWQVAARASAAVWRVRIDLGVSSLSALVGAWPTAGVRRRSALGQPPHYRGVADGFGR